MVANKNLVQGGATPTGKASAKAEDSNQDVKRSSRNCLHKQLRKTKFCMFHLQGACQFGKDCAFAHSVTEMNSTPDLRKTQLCKAFADGQCLDPECNFAHGEVELRSTDMFFKKSLCIWNEKGKCRNGSQCRFAHGLAELRLYINKDADAVAESSPQSKGGRRRKGKQNPQTPSTSGSGTESTFDTSTKSTFDRQQSSGSSSDLSQHSAAEPMKVQPQSVSPQDPGLVVADSQEAQLFNQSHDSLVGRLGSLEADYLALEAARWQQQLNSMAANRYNPDLQADLESLWKGIGMLTAQYSQIQERMQTAAAKPPPFLPYMLPSNDLSKPYPNPDAMQLWQMQMQHGV